MRVFVSGEWREIPDKWWDDLEGPKPPPGFVNNGCTRVFNEIWGVILWPACVIHDWHYDAACEEITSRAVADLIFMYNTYHILRFQKVSRIRSLLHAIIRYRGVRRLGADHFRSGRDEG